MTKIYLIRHCEAMGNAARTLQGSIDCNISELGEKQLECLAVRMKSVSIDRVYSSPLFRAVKTAAAFSEPKGLPITKMDDLRELSCGVLENVPFAEMFSRYPDLADAWDNHPQDFNPPGGEPMRQGYERIWNAIRTIVRDNPGKTVAVTSHGGVLRCLACRIMYGSIESLAVTPWCDNVSVSLIEIDDDGRMTLCFYNDHSHLPEELSPRRNRIPGAVAKGTSV